MAGVAFAADYPDHPIRFIVPQAAGSATDNVARILASVIGPELGQPVIVDDRPGGALTLGLDLVAKSVPDGYTIGMGPIGALAITRHMVAKLPYVIERDFQPIALVARGHLLLAVSPQLPVKSVTELIAYAKANPGKLTNASSSNGSPGHVGAELFKFMTGTQIVHVPYRGGAPAVAYRRAVRQSSPNSRARAAIDQPWSWSTCSSIQVSSDCNLSLLFVVRCSAARA
jgi:tripartite-type tricarboxylate transporter receptor subunit TctC